MVCYSRSAANSTQMGWNQALCMARPQSKELSASGDACLRAKAKHQVWGHHADGWMATRLQFVLGRCREPPCALQGPEPGHCSCSLTCRKCSAEAWQEQGLAPRLLLAHISSRRPVYGQPLKPALFHHFPQLREGWACLLGPAQPAVFVTGTQRSAQHSSVSNCVVFMNKITRSAIRGI